MRKSEKKIRFHLSRAISLAALVGFVFPRQAGAETSAFGPSTLYYDADEINLDKDTGNMKAKGRAFFLLGNIFVSADHVEYNQKQKLLIAEGGVRIVRSKERITASRVIINEMTNEARMDDVEIYADPTDTDAKVNEEVLNISRAEIAFETARQERAQEIRQELGELRTKFGNLRDSSANRNDSEKRKITGRYAQLLERLVRTQYQPSDVLRDLTEEERKRIEGRREAVRTLATRDPELAKKLAGLQKVPGYLKMKAKRVFQNANMNLDVESASLTTCRCGTDEDPAWGLSAAKAFVEPNEYITLYGTTLDVANFPLVFSPWFKMPIKTKRQSGFLLPSFYLSRAGDAASVPYFLTLGDSADATMTFTYFSKRGPRAELELRSSLSEQSQTTLRGEILQQKPGDGSTQQRRWAWAAQSNFPIERRTSFKMDLEKTSDQRYFADISKEPGTTQDLFTPQQIVKRFLWQELAFEHSGEHLSVSAKIQKPQDIFSTQDHSSPIRTPRIDLYLFPKTVRETALSFDGFASYEKIDHSTSDKKNDQTGPWAGERNQTLLRMNYPLAPNRIFNSKWEGELSEIRYRTNTSRGNVFFPATRLSADIPLVADVMSDDDGSSERRWRHSITPFAHFRFIPLVEKSANYPDIYSTFYASDNVARHQTLEFGFHTHVAFFKDTFFAGQRDDVSITQNGQRFSSPAQESVALKIAGFPSTSVTPEAQQFLYELTQQNKKMPQLFDHWAEQELQMYLTELAAGQKNSTGSLLAIKPTTWRRTNLITAQPLNLSISSSYNFEAQRTAQEQNRNLQAGQTPVSAAPWGDVSSALTVSSQPWIPLTTTVTRVWRPSWRRFKDQSITAEFNSLFGWTISMVRSTALSETVGSDGTSVYPADQIWGLDSSYQPKNWLKFQLQYRKNIKPQPAPSDEFEYSSLQKISFLGIQDCVDITLQRFKDRDVAERLATWTIGLNLNFLGQQRQIESLGKVVDRAIKSQLNKGSNLNRLQ
jgi:LPS-assembly protein